MQGLNILYQPSIGKTKSSWGRSKVANRSNLIRQVNHDISLTKIVSGEMYKG